jgi:hypothetical protein
MFGGCQECLRLRQELASERLRVSELTKAVIALSDRGAFRSLYPEQKKEEVVKKALDPIQGDPRREVYKPRLSHAEVIEAMNRKAERGEI